MVHTRGARRRNEQDLQRAIQESRQTARRTTYPRDWHAMLQRARRGVYPKRYKPSDTSHRHRLDDTQDKDIQVSSYHRRS